MNEYASGVRSVARRDRNTGSRYEYPDDRKVFLRWVRAAGPCSEAYWYFDELRQFLYLKAAQGEYRVQYCIHTRELDSDRRGWRFPIAVGLRLIRRELRLTARISGVRKAGKEPPRT